MSDGAFQEIRDRLEVIAEGKIQVARNKKEKLPEGAADVVLDLVGEPTFNSALRSAP